MFETRLAVGGDAELIAHQRMRMFVDAGQAEEGAAMQTMMEKFAVWVRPRLQDGSYVGWIVEQGGRAVAGAGMWLMDFPPHWMDAEPVRAYLLNFYVARRRGVKVVTLHASKFGRPIYERNGFEASTEMMLRL
jgi:hypothetical protein